MTDIIICAVTNLFRIYLIGRFVRILLGREAGSKSSDRVKHMLAYGGFFVINTAVYLAFHAAWLNIACNLAGIGLIVLTDTRTVRKVLFVTCSVYLIQMGCDTLAVSLFVKYRDGLEFSQIYEVVTVFLIFICELLTEKIVNGGGREGNSGSIFLGLVPLCSIGMLCVQIYTESSTETGLVTASVGLILINFSVFYLYNIISDAISQQFETEILRREMQGYENQLEVLRRGEDRIRALRHDMKHHMNELKILAAKGENEAVEAYIDSMEEFIASPGEIVSSGNPDTDSLLNYMLRRAKEELRTVNANVCIPEELNHSFDINVILGNLLENGIEAARQTEEKSLDVNIESGQGVFRLQIENSYSGKVVFGGEKGGQRLFTTKKEKALHGIGLENVRKIVEKYNGLMEVCPSADTFRVRLVLYL